MLSETCNDKESGNKSDDGSTLSLLIIEEEMYAMSSGDESDGEPMSTDMLEDIRNRSQYHSRLNRREARYKIFNCFKQRQAEWKG